MNLYDNEIMKNWIKANPSYVLMCIRANLGKHIENCEDLDDLIQEVYLKVLELNTLDSAEDKIKMDIRIIAKKVAYEYLKDNHNLKNLKEDVSQENIGIYQLEELS